MEIQNYIYHTFHDNCADAVRHGHYTKIRDDDVLPLQLLEKEKAITDKTK